MTLRRRKSAITIIMTLLFLGQTKLWAVTNDNTTDSVRKHYRYAYELLEAMLQLNSHDFKTAVYYVENAYFDNTLSYEWFDQQVKLLAILSGRYAGADNIIYPYEDSQRVLKYAAAFKIMTDSIPIMFEDGIRYHVPYGYNFDDFNGARDWSNTFVTTLLETHKGNCHSLPYLYKMIVQEVGENAYLALAPNHIYIKLYCKKDGWYNTELTSGQFPIDAWLMASGYIHLNAVQNGIYMDTLSDCKSIALCVFDLAQGYQRKMGMGDGSFMLTCCDLALRYFPDCIPVLLLQSEIYGALFTEQLNNSTYKTPQEFIDNDNNASVLFSNIQTLTKKIHALGYRRMPEKMYLDWLTTLATEREKYTNKNISFINAKQR